MSDRAAGYYWLENQGRPPIQLVALYREGVWRPPVGRLPLDAPLESSGPPGSEPDGWRVLAGPLQPLDGHSDYGGPSQTKAALDRHMEYVVELTAERDAGRRELRDLRSRARALLEGTTPGPWEEGLWGTVIAPDGSTLMDGDRDEDARFVLVAHALLTELAKEET